MGWGGVIRDGWKLIRDGVGGGGKLIRVGAGGGIIRDGVREIIRGGVGGTMRDATKKTFKKKFGGGGGIIRDGGGNYKGWMGWRGGNWEIIRDGVGEEIYGMGRGRGTNKGWDGGEGNIGGGVGGIIRDRVGT